MNNFCVRTVKSEFAVTGEEKDLILKLPMDETLRNRFPFEDFDRKGCEVFKKGSEDECLKYLNDMSEKIKCFFIIDSIADEENKELV